MKASFPKKMALNRETLRRLAGADLKSVNGGAPPDTDETCYHTCINSCTCK